MRISEAFPRIAVILLGLPTLLLWSGCKTDVSANKEAQSPGIAVDSSFDQARWRFREGREYPYRGLMFGQLLHSDTLRQRDRADILWLLGEPDRENKGYLYYRVQENRLGPVTLSAKYLVFKFNAADSVAWIRLHE